MLKSIKLKDFAIVDACEIPFAPGLNIISGETGAGKTILTKALRLCLGEKADSAFIRKGAELAIVEAHFSNAVLRRELRRDGKNRLFLNGAPAMLAELAHLDLFDLVSQNESASLRSKETQRLLLDTFAGISLDTLGELYRLWQESERALAALHREKATLLPKLGALEKELEEIDDLGPEEGEIDALFALHKEHMEALASEEKKEAIAERLSHALAEVAALSPPPSIVEHVKGAKAHLEEASYLIEKERMPFSAGEIEKTADRLSALNALFKRYGGSYEAVMQARDALDEKVSFAQSIDQFIYEKEKEGEEALATLQKEADRVSCLRKTAATQLSTLVSADLKELNMPHAEFVIDLSPAPLSPFGSDAIAFHLRANRGEAMLPLTEAPSGGEISRLLFALKLHLSSAETIIFDEIDANIGGETARAVGEKLSALGKKKQVLCITHFPQVAALADHHLAIEKKIGERTLCHVRPLSAEERKAELLRMLGGNVPTCLG